MATNIQARIPSLLRATLSSQNATRKLATLTQASPYDIQHSNPIVRRVIPIPIAKYGGRHTVTMLPGAGIGPEMMHYVRVIFSAIYCTVYAQLMFNTLVEIVLPQANSTKYH